MTFRSSQPRRLYYSRFEKAGPRVYHHVIGQPASQDRVVFGQAYGRRS